MLAEGVVMVERGIALVWLSRVFSRGAARISTSSWMESTGVISPTEPGESRAYSSLKTLVLAVLDEFRSERCRADVNDPSLDMDCGAIGAVHLPPRNDL